MEPSAKAGRFQPPKRPERERPKRVVVAKPEERSVAVGSVFIGFFWVSLSVSWIMVGLRVRGIVGLGSAGVLGWQVATLCGGRGS